MSSALPAQLTAHPISLPLGRLSFCWIHAYIQDRKTFSQVVLFFPNHSDWLHGLWMSYRGIYLLTSADNITQLHHYINHYSVLVYSICTFISTTWQQLHNNTGITDSFENIYSMYLSLFYEGVFYVSCLMTTQHRHFALHLQALELSFSEPVIFISGDMSHPPEECCH